MLIGNGRISLHLIEQDEHVAIRDGVREGRPWFDEYPTPGDVLMSTLVLETRTTLATVQAPWGPLQIRETLTGLAIGGIGFKGAPDVKGAVEIGYAVGASRRRCSVATEAVRLIAVVAKARGVGALLAETTPDNHASQRVVEKAGFIRTEHKGEALWWRLEL